MSEYSLSKFPAGAIPRPPPILPPRASRRSIAHGAPAPVHSTGGESGCSGGSGGAPLGRWPTSTDGSNGTPLRVPDAVASAVAASDCLEEVLDAIGGGVFSPDDHGRYRPLVDSLKAEDWFMVAADFDSYLTAQTRAALLYRDPQAWRREAVLNTAGMGWFSSDRSITEYASDIWGVPVAP